MLDRGRVNIDVLVNGSSKTEELFIEKITVNKRINKIASAKIVLSSVHPTEEQFKDIESDDVIPGSEIEIKAGIESQTPETIFKGLVIKTGLKMKGNRVGVVLECKDQAIKLTSGRKNRIYTEMTDDAVIKEITSNYNGLTTSIEKTNTEHFELIQHQITDWDYLNIRAESNGMQVVNSDGEINIKKVGVNPKENGKIELGVADVLDVNLELDARNHYSKVKAVGWDLKNSEIYSTEISSGEDLNQGDVKLSKLNTIVGEEGQSFHTSSAIASTQIDDIAQAIIDRSNLSKVKGSIKCWASPEFIPGDGVTLEGFSTRFDGTSLVSGVQHVLENNQWETTLDFGLESSSYTEINKNVFTTGGAGSISPMSGLAIGIVQQIHEDPEGQHRVQVTLSTLDDDTKPVWARLSVPYVGSDSGFFFFPEIGNEVVIGFMNDDPAYPIVLGNMFSSNVAPSYTSDEENTVKSIKTLAGLEIAFKEEDKVIEILTPDSNKITIDDTNKAINIVDVSGNEVAMTEDGISLTSAKDLIIDATGDIKMTATGNIEMEATADLKLAGINVTAEGTAGFEAKGPQVAVKGDAMTEISGGIVKIN